MGLFRWFRKTPEARAAGLTFDQLLSLTTGGPSWTGKSVSEESAMTFSAFFSCVRVLAESIGSLPLITYERIEGGKKRLTSHPAYYLLHTEPNPETTAVMFKEQMQAHLCMWGNAYAFIERNYAGRPKGLHLMLPTWVTPERKDGRKVYKYDDGSTKKTLEDREVLHIPGFGWDGLQGTSVVSLVKQAVGLGQSAEEFGAKFFANGTQTGGILKHPGTLTQDAIDRLKQNWVGAHGGTDNAWKPAVVEEGMSWESMAIPPKDAQYLELRKFQAEDVARFFRVPPHLIGIMDSATFSNIEHQSLEFVKFTLRPWLAKWEQEISRKLFKPSGGKVFAEFLIEDLLRADTITRFQAYREGLQGGWLSPNEVRAKENMNPIEGGDRYFFPLNMGQIGGDDAPAEDEPVVNDDQRAIIDAHRALFEDAIGRILAKECDRAKRAAGKHTTPEAFAAWAKEYLEAERAKMLDALMIPSRAFVAATGSGKDAMTVVQTHLDEYLMVSRAELDEAFAKEDFTGLPCPERRATQAEYLIEQLGGCDEA